MSKNERPNEQSWRSTAIRGGVAAFLVVALAAALTPAALSRQAAHASAVSLNGTDLEAPVNLPTSQEDALHIELSTAGFSPAEVTHAAGAFAIAVDNRDVTEEYVLQLKGEGGALLKEVRVEQGSVEWTVELAAGRYTLMVAGHPDWVCQMDIQ